MKSLFFKAIFLLALVVSFFGCKNELQVNADYDAQAVIYGIIDPYDSAAVFRITKSFSGEGDPSTYAEIPDSSYFRDVDLVLKEFLYGNEGRSWPLIKTTISNKEPGDFFGPEQVVYTVTPDKNSSEPFYFNPEAEFVLEGTCDDEEILGKFTIVQEQKSNPFFLSSSNKFTRFWGRQIALVNGAKINDLTFDLTFPKGTKVGGLNLVFTYYETYAGATEEVEKTIEFNLGEKIFDNANEPGLVELKFSGERFYERIGSSLKDAAEVPGLLYRKAGPVDFRMVAVTEDLFYYRQVKNVSEGIAQDRPEYTNLENAFGVLAGRQLVTMNEQLVAHGNVPTEVLLSKFSDDELATGIILGYTGAKGFCSDPSHNLSSSCK